MTTFEGKAVLVTGGARGIGRAIARAFAARGARVAITYLTRGEEAQATLAALPGGGHLTVRADLTDPAQAERAVAAATSAFGRLDVVVNNAGIWEAHPIDTASSEEWLRAWQRTLAVNLLAPANVCYFAARWMKEHGGGRIVNMSSRGAFRGEPEAPGYAASKAGVNAMSQSLAQRLAPHGITSPSSPRGSSTPSGWRRAWPARAAPRSARRARSAASPRRRRWRTLSSTSPPPAASSPPVRFSTSTARRTCVLRMTSSASASQARRRCACAARPAPSIVPWCTARPPSSRHPWRRMPRRGCRRRSTTPGGP